MGKLEERLSKRLSRCATDASVKNESDTLKAPLASLETRCREEQRALVNEINAHKALTNGQTAPLDMLTAR